ncbi:MAG: serine hydrolase domain-containing protein [Saprospiraceae bacterium]
MKTKLIYAFLLVSFWSSVACAQMINKAKLDSLFSLLAEKNKAMGSIALSKNGKILYSKAIGYSSITERDKTPATDKTKYRIGSISKMFTATMIFELIEERKIKLTETLDTYFPDIPNANEITISHLLNHRSGIHNFTDDEEYANYMTLPKTEDEMIAIISKNKPDFEPNEKASYSNSNFVLLGYIIEKITKKPYATNLSERITSKIGLSDTYYGGKTNITNIESYSYSYTNKWDLEPETDMSIPGGAGAIVSTPVDLTKFIEALFSLKLVSKESLSMMKTMKDNYGMGMFQMPFYTRKGFGHNGGIDGFGSTVGYFPDDSIAIAYCTNGQVYGMNDILIGVLSIYFNMEYTLPVFSSIQIKPEDLDIYIGTYSSPEIQIKIAITKSGSTLMAQASGQSAFPLEATAPGIFSFGRAGIVLEFNTADNEMTLKQGGGSFVFKKDN